MTKAQWLTDGDWSQVDHTPCRRDTTRPAVLRTAPNFANKKRRIFLDTNTPEWLFNLKSILKAALMDEWKLSWFRNRFFQYPRQRCGRDGTRLPRTNSEINRKQFNKSQSPKCLFYGPVTLSGASYRSRRGRRGTKLGQITWSNGINHICTNENHWTYY